MFKAPLNVFHAIRMLCYKLCEMIEHKTGEIFFPLHSHFFDSFDSSNYGHKIISRLGKLSHDCEFTDERNRVSINGIGALKSVANRCFSVKIIC